jgi:hypothetical protein
MNNTLLVSQLGSNQHKTKYRFTHKNKAIIAAAIFLFFTLTSAIYALNEFFSTHELIFQRIVSIDFQSPIRVVERVKPAPEIIRVFPNTPLTPTQQYICDKFGTDCKMALAVAKAENATWQCDRFGINKNGTLDWGLFQINTIHLKNVDLKSLLDCEANVDFAYKLFKAQGWQPWVAYTSKAYLKFMY